MAGLIVVGTRPLRADVRARSGDLAEAIAMFPTEPAYRVRAGHVAYSLARASRTPGEQRRWLEKGLDRFQEALRLRPRSTEYMSQLARTEALWARSLDPTRFTEAERWWRRALASDPTNRALRRLYDADVAFQRRAASELEASLTVQPESLAGWVRVGQSHLGLRQPERAKTAFEAALRIEPGNQEARRLIERASRAAVGSRAAR